MALVLRQKKALGWWVLGGLAMFAVMLFAAPPRDGGAAENVFLLWFFVLRDIIKKGRDQRLSRWQRAFVTTSHSIAFLLATGLLIEGFIRRIKGSDSAQAHVYPVFLAALICLGVADVVERGASPQKSPQEGVGVS